ncbi:MAG: hypothetical protein WD052_02710 [Bacteroidales bacterium]
MRISPLISLHPVRWITVCVLPMFFLLNGIQAQEPFYSINNYSKNNYKAEYQNWKADVGPDQFIYIANNAGLLIFDGVNWEFKLSPEITNLRAVRVDSISGRVYTAGYRELGYWEWDSLGSLNYTSLNPMVENHYSINEEFWNIIILDNSIYFQSFLGVFIFTDNKFHVIRTNGFANTMSIVGNEILISVRDRGLYKIEGDSIVSYLLDPFFNEKLIRFLVPWQNGNLLIGTSEHGVYSYNGKSFSPAFAGLTDYFSRHTINRACLLNDDTLVIGTLLDGLMGISADEKVIFRINEETGLQNNTVLDILTYENNLWAALDRGISFIDLHPDQSYRIHPVNEIGATYSAAVFEDRLYLGTNQGLYVKPLDADDDQFVLVEGTQAQVWDCTVYENQLFVGHNSGTFVIREGRIRQLSNVAGGFNLIKNSFRLNTLIQSTYSDLVLYNKSKESWSISHNIRNFSDLIRYIELDHLNHLWAGHMRRSVYKLTLNDRQDSVLDIRYYGKNSIFNKDYGINVFKVENRIVFTTGEKLYTYDDINDTIIPYEQLNRSLGKYTSAHRIVKAPDHHYWFITDNSTGLFHFMLTGITLVKDYPTEIFDYHIIENYENVVPINKYEAIYCLENGYAMLNADPAFRRTQKQDIQLTIRNISLLNNDGSTERLPLNKKKYIIPYSKNSLTLQYAFPDYTSSQTRFRYLLSGLQPNWSEPTYSAEFHLNRIPAGEYVMKVIAENEWLEESEPHQIYLKVLPPWYRSTLSLFLFVNFLILIIIYVRYTSVKKVKAREKKKRDIKEQELIKLRNQNLRTELTFKSRELANSTMSIIKKNEFLMNLQEILKEQKYQLGTRYPDKFYNSVVNKIDKNIASGDDWRIFETNVEKAHEFFIQKMIEEFPQLTHSDLRLCTYLRMNLSSKEIAPLMKISVRGVENHRYRLRKKLKLSPEVNLTDFILAFKV